MSIKADKILEVFESLEPGFDAILRRLESQPDLRSALIQAFNGEHPKEFLPDSEFERWGNRGVFLKRFAESHKSEFTANEQDLILKLAQLSLDYYVAIHE